MQNNYFVLSDDTIENSQFALLDNTVENTDSNMTEINNVEELDAFILSNCEKIVVLYFSAPWCGPCQKLKNKIINNFDKMCNLAICSINIDDNPDLVNSYNITILPTQIFIKLVDEKRVEIYDKIVGSDFTKFIFNYNKLEEENQ